MAEENVPEDPRALAERLAREAKARIAAQKVAEAKARAATAPAPAAPAPEQKLSLADRARKVKRPMSAQEALAAAMSAPPPPAPTRAPQPAAPKPSPAAPRPVETSARLAPAVTPAPPPPRTEVNPAAELGRAAGLVTTLLPGAQLKGAPVAATNPEVFRALWKAHRARALHEGDLAVVATASVLLDAIDRVPAGRLFGVRVEVAGQEHALWLDTERKALLGVAAPADVYLTGL